MGTRPPGQPLVSVGFPVRNGGEQVKYALESVIQQTHTNLEIIISDNGSTDGTRAVCEALAARDPRVRYHRHDPPLTAWQNFRFVFEQAKGQYFMWAAHDDMRTLNYIEVLLRGYAREPLASLVFSDLAMYDNYSTYSTEPTMPHDFDTRGLTFAERVIKQTHSNCSHIYGLINSHYLRDYPWYDLDYGPDVAMLLGLATRGPLVYEPGARFYRWTPSVLKSDEERTQSISYRPLQPFPRLRLAWVSARTVAQASEKKGERATAASMFFPLYYHMNQGLKGIVYSWAPPRVQKLWQSLKSLGKGAQLA